MIQATIKGSSNLREAAKLLRKLPDEFVVKDVKAETKAGMQVVKKDAIARAPVDTGRLREMIEIKSGFSKRQALVFARVGLVSLNRKAREKIQQKKTEGKLGLAEFETDAFYGKFVELGTEHQAPQPFLRPAFDQNIRTVFAQYGDNLKRRLEKRAAKIGQTPRRKIS